MEVKVSGRTRDVGPLLRARFGQAVRKLPLRVGATCPTRDGTRGSRGCLFCAGTPASELSLEQQLEAGLARLGDVAVIAYLQDHTATHLPAAQLDRILARLRACRRIVRIAIGTRPDCLPEPVLDVLARHGAAPLDGGPDLLVELGLQTADDHILSFVGRLHTASDFSDAVRRLHREHLAVCAHVILGLPSPQGEPRGVWRGKGRTGALCAQDGALSPEPVAGAIRTARLLGELGVEAVKIHNCHVLRDTELAALFFEGRYTPPTLDGYIDRLAGFLEHLPSTVEIHRLVAEARPPDLVAPEFCADKSRTLQQIRAELERRDVWQGSKWTEGS
jgi:hypothetical protein